VKKPLPNLKPPVEIISQKAGGADNCVLAIYGDVETAEVKSAVEKTFRPLEIRPCGERTDSHFARHACPFDASS